MMTKTTMTTTTIDGKSFDNECRYLLCFSRRNNKHSNRYKLSGIQCIAFLYVNLHSIFIRNHLLAYILIYIRTYVQSVWITHCVSHSCSFSTGKKPTQMNQRNGARDCQADCRFGLKSFIPAAIAPYTLRKKTKIKLRRVVFGRGVYCFLIWNISRLLTMSCMLPMVEYFWTALIRIEVHENIEIN